MTNFKNIKSDYQKIKIDNYIFIKEETRDENFGLIHIEIYLKTMNHYRMVDKTELPQTYISELSNDKKYEPLTFVEIMEFKKYKNEMIEKIKKTNDIENRVCELFGNIYEINRDINFFTIHTDFVNEFYKVKIKEFNSLMIPYIICDLIEKNKNYNNQLFLIGTNLFVQVSDMLHKKICSLIQVNDKTGECQIIAVYIIEKNQDKYEININLNEQNINEILRNETRKFIERLEKN